jgi:ATP-dependent RNA helicase RhlE
MIAPAQTVDHAIYPVGQKMKKDLLLAMLAKESTGQVLIFTRTKHRARNLARDLEKQNFRVAALQGNMSQNKRQEAISGFRKGKYDILVATDIAARGIDVSDITHVINFDMPDTVDAYTHRIGRTGRAERSGDAYTLVTPEDADMVRQIERLLKQPLERRKLPGFNYEGFDPETAVKSTPVSTPKPQNNNSRPSRNGNGNGNGRTAQNNNRQRSRNQQRRKSYAKT